jgi:hypothetical protein
MEGDLGTQVRVSVLLPPGGTVANGSFAPILLKKAFPTDERNFLGPLTRFVRRDVRGPQRLSQKRPRTFVSLRRRLFGSLSIFDFFNTIRQKQPFDNR